jgi:hypothetical protein
MGDEAAPLLPNDAGSFPALRRFQAATPVALAELPTELGLRPFGLFVEGLADPLYGSGGTPRALDPGGDLSDWRSLGWCSPVGRPVRVDTRPDGNAVVLWTLEQRARRWAEARSSGNPGPVLVVPELIRRVGRLGVIVEAATVDPFNDHEGLRTVYDERDQTAFVHREARRMGKRAFARRTGLPLKVAERAALGRTIARRNIDQACRALLDGTSLPTCSLPGCDKPVGRPNALYCGKAHRDRAYRMRVRGREPVSHNGKEKDPFVGFSCPACGTVRFGDTKRPCPVCASSNHGDDQ